MIIGGKGMKSEKDESYMSGGEEEGEGEFDARKEAKMEAARAAMRAFKSGDVGGLNEALAAHYKACAGETDVEPMEE